MATLDWSNENCFITPTTNRTLASLQPSHPSSTHSTLTMNSDDFLKVEDLSPTTYSPMLSPALSATTPSATTPTNMLSRRPSRKSTLTQQQKNQKRQRATQDQLATLEIEFSRNPTPTASVRERIAQEINMTERSVQIWFQNRYGSSLAWHNQC